MIGLIAEPVLATKNISNWIVDSGATCHMCNDKSLIADIKDIEGTQDITLGDGYALNATAKGTVELKKYLANGKSQKCRLHDVLYVPELSYNLLSVLCKVSLVNRKDNILQRFQQKTPEI